MERMLHHKQPLPEYTPVFASTEFPLSKQGISAIHGATL